MKASEELVHQIVHTFRANTQESNRPAMEAYMKHHFLFYGIKTPDRNKLLRPILKEFKSISQTERMEAAFLLFSQDERENHYAALSLLEKGAKNIPRSAIGAYHELLKTKPWWDTVDMIASKLCGRYFKQYPEYLVSITESWRNSPNMWVRRSSLLHQLSYKTDTNKELLFATIEQLKGEKVFFIEKAIGWSLREYSKTSPKEVIAFLETTECRPLSRREGLKWMKNKGLLHT